MERHDAPPDAIITGEGVALELPAATALSRMGGGMLDYGLLFFGWLFVIIQTPFDLFITNDALGAVYFVAWSAIFFWLVPALVTAGMRGSSPGRALTKTRVVTIDGGTVTMSQAFIRATVGVFEIWLTFGVLASVSAFVSKRGQRFGDMAAGTYAVRWPRYTSWEPNVSMPPELLEWANLAQSRPLPTGLSLNVADFLKSRARLTPQARQVQARALATACERYVSPPAPRGTDPEAFIEAVTIIRYTVERRRYERTNTRRSRFNERISAMPYGLSEPATTSEPANL